MNPYAPPAAQPIATPISGARPLAVALVASLLAPNLYAFVATLSIVGSGRDAVRAMLARATVISAFASMLVLVAAFRFARALSGSIGNAVRVGASLATLAVSIHALFAISGLERLASLTAVPENLIRDALMFVIAIGARRLARTTRVQVASAVGMTCAAIQFVVDLVDGLSGGFGLTVLVGFAVSICGLSAIVIALMSLQSDRPHPGTT